MLKAGCGVLLKLNFADGGICNKKRTFLVIDVSDKTAKLLNISSVRGKEWKLGIKSNKNINYFNPPFLKKSFAKLDALYIIPNENFIDDMILCNRRRMDPKQLQDVINCFDSYREDNYCIVKEFDSKTLCDMNDIAYTS